MILKTRKAISKYDQFFAMEADTPAKGTKVKKAKLDDTVTDYTDEANNEENKAPEKSDDTEVTDYTDDANEENTNNDEEAQNDEDADGGTDYTDEGDGTNDTEDQSSDGSDDADGGTDYTDEGDGSDPPPDDATEETPEEDSNEDIQMQKYNLYREFMRLYNSMKRYISKLENTVKDDINGNMVIISVTKKLREIQELIYEYLTVKFHSTEYSEALLYFHTCIETIELTFKLLKNNEIFIKQ